MGIPLLWKEIGAGRKVALAKLVEEGYKSKGHFRLGIDISIWSFQIKAAIGGAHPDLRTLFYRLCKLLLLGISPLFVFDGDDRPEFKRNKCVGGLEYNSQHLFKPMKKLIELFGFDWIEASGEAEAELARLQRQGVIDVIMTEDVDALMFSGAKVIRSWRSENSNNAPTHVTMYDLPTIKEEKQLTPAGMILIALMSGGDYIPAGIFRCGIKTAVQAGIAGFGETMLAASSLESWRDDFVEELRTNQQGHFQRKHPVLKVAPDFPNRQVLEYYVNPRVCEHDLQGIWLGVPDIAGLRKFTGHYFNWRGTWGALKFIRAMSPPILSWKILHGRAGNSFEIHGTRTHTSTDSSMEFRCHFVPAEIVGIDLDVEEDQQIAESDDGLPTPSQGGDGPIKSSNFDPFGETRIWILRCLVPSTSEQVGAWELEKKAQRPKGKAQTKQVLGHDQRGALHKYFTTTKPMSKTAYSPNLQHVSTEPGKEIAYPARRRDNVLDPQTPQIRKNSPRGVLPLDEPAKSPSKRVVLRTSLPGSWKEVEDGKPIDPSFNNVEVLDLT